MRYSYGISTSATWGETQSLSHPQYFRIQGAPAAFGVRCITTFFCQIAPYDFCPPHGPISHYGEPHINNPFNPC